MDKQIYTTKEIEFGHNGYKTYRIEKDITDSYRHYQRHIWTKNDGSIEEHDWFQSVFETPEQLVYRGYSKVK